MVMQRKSICLAFQNDIAIQYRKKIRVFGGGQMAFFFLLSFQCFLSEMICVISPIKQMFLFFARTHGGTEFEMRIEDRTKILKQT